MRQFKFDLLPIRTDDPCREYFTTMAWADYSTAERRRITHHDVIAHDTPIREVLRRFAEEERSFFFLGDQNAVVGLISIANLNCRQVALFVLGLLVELEVRLGDVILEEVGDGLLDWTRERLDRRRSDEIESRYLHDQERGVDAAPIEYLYLSDLARLAVDIGMHRRIGMTKRAFKSTMGSLVELRNRVAHPTRSLVDTQHSVQTLWRRIDRAEEVLFGLR